MAEEVDFNKIPLEDRVQHKVSIIYTVQFKMARVLYLSRLIVVETFVYGTVVFCISFISNSMTMDL